MCEMLCCTASTSNPEHPVDTTSIHTNKTGGPAKRQIKLPQLHPQLQEASAQWLDQEIEKFMQRAGRWALVSSFPVALGSISPDPRLSNSTSELSPLDAERFLYRRSVLPPPCNSPGEGCVKRFLDYHGHGPGLGILV